MNIVNLIKQISRAHRVHKELNEQIELSIGSKKHVINAEGLYKQNERQFYVLLRCSHELDQFLEKQSEVLTFEEKTYFETLLTYVRSLLKTIQYFPKLTYFYWQKSLGRYQDRFYQTAFVGDWNKYQVLEARAGMMLGRVKRFI